MSNPSIHWEEGMFLRPHHFQAAQRHGAQSMALGDKWDLHYNWGLRALDLNQDALANARFEVRSLRARLRDGTLIAVPEDGVLTALDLKGVLDGGRKTTVHLAVPVYNPSRNNVPLPGQGGDVRYRVESLRLEDENTGVNSQTIRFRRPNLKLMTEDQDRTGYETIPIGRLERSAGAGASPQLDRTYIPPVLACDAWTPLAQEIIRAIYDRIGRKIEILAAQAVSKKIPLDSTGRSEMQIFGQLREMNPAYAMLGVLAFAEGVHPLSAYVELARIVGQLSLFDPDTRRPPDLPRYDHDDLGRCFYAIKRYIDGLLDLFVEPEFKERPFVGEGLRMQVEIESSWLEPSWEMFIGVQTPLEREECTRLLTTPGVLDMKVGSARRVDAIFKTRDIGLRFASRPSPPRDLPRVPGLIFFQIDRDSEPEEWLYVQQSRSLAIRLNQARIEGDIQGQRVVTILKPDGQSTTMQFTLYVVPTQGIGAKPVESEP